MFNPVYHIPFHSGSSINITSNPLSIYEFNNRPISGFSQHPGLGYLGGWESGGYATTSAAPYFNIGTKDFAISYWYSPYFGWSYNQYAMFDIGGTLYERGTGANGNIRFFGVTGGVTQTVIETNAATGSGYKHYVLQRKQDVVSLYINGVFNTSSTYAGTITASAGMRVGYGIANPVTYGLMLFGDFRLYDRALTQTDIDYIYNNGLGTFSWNTPYTSPNFDTQYHIKHIKRQAIHQWKLNDGVGTTTVLDYGSTTNNGAVTSVVLGSAGKIRTSAYFTGTASYIASVNNLVLTGTVTRTFSAWFKTAKVDYTTEGYLFSGGSSGANTHFGVAAKANPATWQFTDGAGWFDTGKAIKSDFSWQHLVCIYKYPLIEIYVDTTKVYAATFTSLNTGSGPLYIGRYMGASSAFLYGYVEDVRVYNYALNQDEISAIYNSGAGTYYDAEYAGDFNAAAKLSDAKSVYRLKMAPRYDLGSMTSSFGNFMTLNTYVINGGLGTVQYGIDDQDWLQGVTRIGELNIEVDNTNRKFNNRLDPESLWYTSTTPTYYMANSYVELEYGFELPTGSTIYSQYPFHCGLIRGDSITYDINRNTCKFSVLSLFDQLNTYTHQTIIDRMVLQTTGNRTKYYTNYGITYEYDYLNGAFSPYYNSKAHITFTAINYRTCVEYSDYTKTFDKTFYEHITTMSKETGSIFGFNRKKESFVTYYNNPYGTSYYGNFLSTTNIFGLWALQTNTSFSYGFVFLDTSGNNNHLTFTTAYNYRGIKRNTNRFTYYRPGGPSGPPGGLIMSGYADYSANAPALLTKAGGWTWDTTTSTFEFFITPLIRYFSPENDNTSTSAVASWNFSNVGGDNIRFSLYLYPRPEYVLYEYNSGTYRRQKIDFTQAMTDATYVAIVNNEAANTHKVYFNGVKVLSTTASPINTKTFTPVFGFPTSNINAALVIEGLRVVKRELSDSEILATNAYLWKNKFIWATTSAYTYSINNDIYSLDAYEDGRSRIYNKIVYQTSDPGTDRYYTQFTYPYGNTITTAVQVVIDDFSSSKYVIGTYTAGAPDPFITIFNSIGNNISYERKADSGAYGSLQTVWLSNWKQDGLASQLYLEFTCNTSTGVSNILTYSAYASYADALTCRMKFVPNYLSSTYEKSDTASVAEYGPRVYTLKDKETVFASLNEFNKTATELLTLYKDPKIRTRITTRFLLGDLDLFSRITLTYNPPTRDGFLRWDSDEWDTGRSEKYTGESIAGNITWTTKDFWVIGIEHDYKGQRSTYTLREV